MGIHEGPGKSNDWYTPRHVFDALGERFDVDVAAPRLGPRYVPANEWFCDTENGLAKRWFGFVWMNPPFGNQETKILWLTKFFEHGDGIALMPDRTSAPWWQKFAGKSDAVLFVAPKLKFERPDGSIGKSPGSGTVLMASGGRGRNALVRARSLGLVFENIKEQ